MKKKLKIFLGLIIISLVISCTSDNETIPNKPKSLDNTSIPKQAEYGGKLILASIGEPSNLIPALATDSASHEVADFLYTSLLKYDKEYNIVPLAAEKYEILENGCLFRFELKKNIYWHDGEKLTADDVTFTYYLMTNPKTPTPYAADYLTIKEYKQTGKYSFEVRYDKPYARAIITWMLPILPKHILEYEDITKTKYSRQPIGAGPFKLKEWHSGSRLVLEANEKYFEGRPYLNQLVYRIIPDVTTIFLEAKAGKVDFLGLTAQQFLMQTNGIYWEEYWKKHQYLASGYTYIGFNLTHPFFKDKRVRQALAYATDRDAVIKGALLGLGTKTIGPYKPNTWVYNDKIIPYSYNEKKALELFAKAGWKKNKQGILEKDGKPFAFTILVNQGSKERENVLLVLQQYWKKLGIDIKICTVEWATFINEFVLKGQYDAVILAWNILEDPDIYDVWHSSAIKPNGLNFVHFKNKEVDMLLEKGRETADRQIRKKYYDRLQEILHDEQPYLFLYVPYSLPMVQKRFQGIDPAISGITHNMEKWWLPNFLQ